MPVILYRVVLLVVVLQLYLVVVVMHEHTGSIFGADDSDFADGSTAGSCAVYGRGILLDGGSSSGADGLWS